jgi:hypothetical protein
LCLLSKTKKAEEEEEEEVRTYYLELKKLINNYKNYIIEGLQNTVNMLENNQKEIPSNIKGTVYILKSPKDINGIYRFGQTEDFKKRIQNYNSANSDKMKIIKIYEIKNAKKVKTCVLGHGSSLVKICNIFIFLHLWRFKTPIFYNNLYINYYAYEFAKQYQKKIK